MILVADIGGTKTDVVLVSRENLTNITYQKRFMNKNFQSIDEILDQVPFNQQLSLILLGIAGPVIEGTVRMTNLDWEISEDQLSQSFGVQASILNDLEAMAYYVTMSFDSLIEVKDGTISSQGLDVIVGVGTGLGKAIILHEDHPLILASEAGHIGFSPHTAFEEQFYQYLRTTNSHVSVEMVCSGKGIYNLIDFLKHTPNMGIPPAYCNYLLNQQDPVATMFKAVEDQHPNTSNLSKIFKHIGRMLGSYLGDLALLHLPNRIFLSGGLAFHLYAYFDFLVDGFLDKGEMKYRIQEIPIYLINDPLAGVKGLLEFYQLHS